MSSNTNPAQQAQDELYYAACAAAERGDWKYAEKLILRLVSPIDRAAARRYVANEQHAQGKGR